MKLKQLLTRFLIPQSFNSLYYFFKYRCVVSTRAEVELSSNLFIGKGSQISSFVKIKASNGLIKIGEKVDIATGSFLSGGPGGLKIGDNCLIGPNCIILSRNYNLDRLDKTFRDQGHRSKGTCIGDNVLIGGGTVINDGSQIGSNVAIAANSMVSGKIPSNTIVQGNPAKVIFTRR